MLKDLTKPASQVAMQGGFKNPVMQSQKVFRNVMEAMARPGLISPLEDLAIPPAPLSPTSASLLVTLADADTPIWLDPALDDNSDIRDWLTFQTGAPFAKETATASFAVIAEPQKCPPFESFAAGLQDYPDRSTTIILQIDQLSNAADWTLTGPGIKDQINLHVEPNLPLFAAQWAQNNAQFPRGVDVVLAGSDSIVCLPRTTKIQQIEPTI